MAPVQKQCRRRFDPEFHSVVHVVLDQLRKLSGIESAVETSSIEPNLSRVTLQLFHSECRLIAQQQVHVLPVTTLFTRTLSCFSSLKCLAVLSERKVARNQPYLIPVLFNKTLQILMHGSTTRTLVIDESD